MVWRQLDGRVADGGFKDVWAGFPLDRESLAKLRLRAVRRGVWFRDLKVAERRLLDLTIGVVRRVRSFVLAGLISRIVEKLLFAVEGRVSRLMCTTGRGLAQRLGEIAQSWGHRSAAGWCEDLGFVRFLAVMHLSEVCAGDSETVRDVLV